MDSQFSPFTTPQSPALLMPPPSLPPPSLQPPSLPQPLTNERPNETPPHNSGLSLSHSTDRMLSHLGSHGQHQSSDMKMNMLSGGGGHLSSGGLNSQNPQSQQPSLSFPGSFLNLPSFAPLSAQGPSTPMMNIASVSDSHLQPTLQLVLLL